MITKFKIFESSEYFTLSNDKWDDFYEIYRNNHDSDSRSICLDILYRIKHDKKYRISKKQYDFLKDNVLNDDNMEEIYDDIDISIPYSSVDNFYAIIVDQLSGKGYSYFKKFLEKIKQRKVDNKIPLSKNEFDLLQRLKTGTIKPEDYSTKN